MITEGGNVYIKRNDKIKHVYSNLTDNINKYEKATILIIMRWSHADGMRTAEQTGNDYGFR